MQTTRDFAPADRYVYDFGPCSSSNGFAQIDTDQDASYFGTWANPFTFTIVSYCEGDVTTTVCNDAEEFVAEIEAIKAWNEESGYWRGIDPGLKGDIEARFRELGLGDLLH